MTMTVIKFKTDESSFHFYYRTLVLRGRKRNRTIAIASRGAEGMKLSQQLVRLYGRRRVWECSRAGILECL